MDKTILSVQGLSKQIGKKMVVDNVSFTVEKGEIFGLLGPNGAGKTTIIRMIVNLIKRSSGTVHIMGHSTDTAFKEAMNELGAIVETPEFYGYMSGYKNLQHYARMSAEKISDSRINEVAQMVGLDHAMHQKVKTYSLGMRQRLGVAQSLLHKPALLILDEPTNGLDPLGIKEFRGYIDALSQQGISILISSHLLTEMQMMCRRFAIIDQGKLTHISSMDENKDADQQDIKPVIFHVSDVDSAAAALAQLNTADGIKLDKETSEISFYIEQESLPIVNELFVQNNIQVYGFHIVKTSLEDRFFKLTKREAQSG